VGNKNCDTEEERGTKKEQLPIERRVERSRKEKVIGERREASRKSWHADQ
jgi:hypothetical protein